MLDYGFTNVNWALTAFALWSFLSPQPENMYLWTESQLQQLVLSNDSWDLFWYVLFSSLAWGLHGWEVYHQSLFHHGGAGGQCAHHTQQDDGVRTKPQAFVRFCSCSILTLNSVSSPRGALGYCFVEMTDEATAERCLRKINGKALPGANPVWWAFTFRSCHVFVLSQLVETVKDVILDFNVSIPQPTRFKLNRATFGKQDIG